MSYTKQKKETKENVMKGTLYTTPGELRQWAQLKSSSSPPLPLPHSSPNSQVFLFEMEKSLFTRKMHH
ncbi:hypothetical protein TNCT_13791 [Trichonephila clavata]|uniref:Uncharacterized protein n=1 Tax=Trichonephila clavata TaxID=2740835 RepID=A0A8X6F8K8_TRICU|nr:hypothetical protein TNCT_13791 [Trichonephila clavata]